MTSIYGFNIEIMGMFYSKNVIVNGTCFLTIHMTINALNLCFDHLSASLVSPFLIIMQWLKFLRGGAGRAIVVDTPPTVADCNCNWLEQFFTYEAPVEQPHPCLRSISFTGDGTWPEIQIIFNGSLKIDWGGYKKRERMNIWEHEIPAFIFNYSLCLKFSRRAPLVLVLILQDIDSLNIRTKGS